MPPALIGTYNPPGWKIGERVFCRVRDKWCKVTSLSDAPVSWTRGQPLKQRGGVGLVVNATLERAIHTESAEALCYHFGVHSGVVWRWRKAFGIEHYGTPGSEALQDEASAKASRTSADLPSSWTLDIHSSAVTANRRRHWDLSIQFDV